MYEACWQLRPDDDAAASNTFTSAQAPAAGSEGALPPGALPAPARHVLTLRPGGDYDFESGSSVAAAELTGVVALLMSASPAHLTAPRLIALLRDSGGTAPGADPTLVNAAVALTRLAGPRRKSRRDFFRRHRGR